MRLIHDLPRDGGAVGPMSRAQRWGCAAVLVLTAPLWVPGLLLAGLAFLVWSLGSICRRES